jgi:hypothetical protein
VRRPATVLATALLMLTAPQLAQAATPADTYVDRIGVNIHTAYLTTQHPQYGYGDKIATALETVGIRHVRDGMIKASPAPHWHWNKLQYIANRVGGSIALILDGKSWYTGPDQALGWIKTYMPAVSVVEGENEADNTGVGGTGSRAPRPGRTASTRRSATTRGSTTSRCWLRRSSPSPATSRSRKRTGRRVIRIRAGTSTPQPRLQSALNVCQPQTPGKPVWITEYGFPHTNPNPCTGQRGVTDAEAARWLPTSLLLAIRAGVPRTYLYELFDSNSCKWGLFTSAGTPRPEVQVLRNWIDLLADTSPSPSRPDTALTVNDPANATATVQFAKSDGSFWVALYPTSDTAGARTVTLTRPAGSTWSWQYHQPAVDKTGHGYVTKKDTFSVPMGDDPVLVRVRPWD